MADSTTTGTNKRDAAHFGEPDENPTAPSDANKKWKANVVTSGVVSSSCDTSDAIVASKSAGGTTETNDAGSSSQGTDDGNTREEASSSSAAPGRHSSSDGCRATTSKVAVEEESSSTENSRDVVMSEEHVGEEVDEAEDDEARGGGGGHVSRTRSKKKQVLVGLKETDVGISEYMSEHEGVPGILKQRYRDFLVNEIDTDGKIIRLTDMTCPEKKSILHFDHNDVLSKDDQEKLLALAKGQSKTAECLIEVTDDKEHRTKVHQAIRHLFPKLDSSTVEDGEKKMVKVTKGGGGKRGRSRWPKEKPNYCRFVLHKENMDVNEALNIVAKYLHIGPHHFQYAGSKDKRGVTVQEVTVHRVDGQRLSQLNKVLRCIRLGNFRYVHKPLSLGELTGNHFVIVLRMIQANRQQIDTAISSLRDVGFINYFGMQRFGNSLISTYHVGRALLLSQWQTAVDLILKPREGGQDDGRWREHWMETRDAHSTLGMLPHHKRSSVEQQLLRGLLKSKNDYLASFSSITRNTRLIYVHSYQSYIWNAITSERLRKHGMSPIVGDLVSKDNKEDEECVLPRVEYVTEENINQFTICDVVLPLPGHGVKYPTHQAGEWYTERLAQDGLTVEMLKHPIRDLSLTGAYRKCVVKPLDVDWALYSYDDVKIPLVPTDLEVLESGQTPEPASEGSHTALKVEFSLPSSCYATMALREFMKTDTSAVHQSSLNV